MYQPNIYGNGTDLNCEQTYVGGGRGPCEPLKAFVSMMLRSLDIVQNLGFENMRCTILLHVWSHIWSSARILVNKKRARVLHVCNVANTMSCINQNIYENGNDLNCEQAYVGGQRPV